MCDLLKVFNFVSSCTLKDDSDGRRYLHYIIYDPAKKCIIGSDGRRLALAFLNVGKYVNLSGIPADNPAPVYIANYDKNTEKIILSSAGDIHFPDYWQCVPKYAAESCVPTEDNPENEQPVDLTWRREYSGTWMNQANEIWKNEREIPAGLFAFLDRQGVTVAPGFLNLPSFRSSAVIGNGWQICHEDAKSPVVFVNDSMNHTYLAGIRMLYVVMPFRRDDENDELECLEKARRAIREAMERAGVGVMKYRVLAGADPSRNKCSLAVLFKVPGDDSREYLAEDFTGNKWAEVLAAVKEWLEAK